MACLLRPIPLLPRSTSNGQPCRSAGTTLCTVVLVNRSQLVKTLWDQYKTVSQKRNAMDPKNPREQEPIDTEMTGMDAPPTGTVPGPGRPLPPVPAKTSETRIAHGTITSAKGVPNAVAAEDPTKQSKLELRRAQEDGQNLGSIARRNTEDSARSLREELGRAREENQSLREGLKSTESEAKEILHKKDDEYNQFYKTTTAQLEKLRAEKAEVDETARKTHLKLQAREEELQKCKDELFNLQPPSQISDAQIGNEWERLCGNITRWIDDQAGGMGSLYSELKRLRQMDKFNDTVALYWGDDRQELAHHASRYPYIMDVLIRYNIHCLLEEKVFSERVYMFGLGYRSAEFLTMIEKQMNALEPRRDRKTIDRWRSETLIAWSAIPDSEEIKRERANEVTREADVFLGPLLPKRTSDAFNVFHRDITLAAIELAGTMRRSTSAYHFISLVDRGHPRMKRPTLPAFGHGGLVHISDFTQSEILDIDSNRNLKPSRLEPNADGSIGDRIMTIYPALCRRGGDGDIVVSKELLLVELRKPLQRRGKPREVESSWGKLSGIMKQFS